MLGDTTLFPDGIPPEYVLQRNHFASTRLNVQHYIYKQSLRFTLHPSIPIQKNIHIGEVACGTAIWLLNAVDILPWNAVLEGWDISDAHFPSLTFLP